MARRQSDIDTESTRTDRTVWKIGHAEDVLDDTAGWEFFNPPPELPAVLMTTQKLTSTILCKGTLVDVFPRRMKLSNGGGVIVALSDITITFLAQLDKLDFTISGTLMKQPPRIPMGLPIYVPDNNGANGVAFPENDKYYAIGEHTHTGQTLPTPELVRSATFHYTVVRKQKKDQNPSKTPPTLTERSKTNPRQCA